MSRKSEFAVAFLPRLRSVLRLLGGEIRRAAGALVTIDLRAEIGTPYSFGPQKGGASLIITKASDKSILIRRMPLHSWLETKPRQLFGPNIVEFLLKTERKLDRINFLLDATVFKGLIIINATAIIKHYRPYNTQ